MCSHYCEIVSSEVAEDVLDDGAPLTWTDKVKVVRTRTRVNHLQAAVKEKEHVFVHNRFMNKA